MIYLPLLLVDWVFASFQVASGLVKRNGRLGASGDSCRAVCGVDLGAVFPATGQYSRAVEFANMQTSGVSILVHTIVNFGLITIFLIAIGVHISTG